MNMDKKQKYLRLVLSVVLSSLLASIAVFGIVYAQLSLEDNTAVIGTLTTTKGVSLNTDDLAIGLTVEGKVGIGFPSPGAELDVDGWVRASGARFDTVIIDGSLLLDSSDTVKVYSEVCNDGEAFRSANNQIIETWCGPVSLLPSNNCVPFLQKFFHNDGDPDMIREISCGVASNRLFIRADTEGGDNEAIGAGSICGAICGLE